MDTGKIVAFKKVWQFLFFKFWQLKTPKFTWFSHFLMFFFTGRKKATYANMYMKVSRLAHPN